MRKEEIVQSLINKIEEIIHPLNMVEMFKDMDEFREWSKLGSKEDLDHAINKFLKYELYEHCQIMKEVKEQKQI